MSCDPIRLVPGPSGQNGADGTNGADGVNAFTVLTEEFAVPLEQQFATAVVLNTAMLAAGETIYLQSGGTYQVGVIIDGTQATLKNLHNTATGAYLTNPTAGIIAIGSAVVPTGIQGLNGTNGTNGVDGASSITRLSAPFAMPTEGNTLLAQVENTAGLAIGQVVFIEGLGYLRVASVTDAVQASFTNLESAATGAYQTNSVAGTIAGAFSRIISAGIQGPSGFPYALYQQREANNTPGGDFLSGAWRTVPINTQVYTSGFSNIVVNTINLAPGTYRCRWRMQGYADAFVSRLQNVFTFLAIETGSAAGSVAGQQTCSFGEARFTIAGASDFVLQAMCRTTNPVNNGFGIQTNLGVQEIYSSIEFWKEL